MTDTLKRIMQSFRTRYYVTEREGRYFPFVDRFMRRPRTLYLSGLDNRAGESEAYRYSGLHGYASREEAADKLREYAGTANITVEDRAPYQT